MFPLPVTIGFMTLHGALISPHTNCIVSIEGVYGVRTPVTFIQGQHPVDSPGPSFEYPCAGWGAGSVYSPADNRPWDGQPCNSPDRPGCAICPPSQYKEHWYLQAGDSLLVSFDATKIEVQFVDPCYIPPPCNPPCSMIDPDNPGHALIYNPSFSGYYKAFNPSASPVDINMDGDIGTDADIEYFFWLLSHTSYDYNMDGDAGTDRDIQDFYKALGGG